LNHGGAGESAHVSVRIHKISLIILLLYWDNTRNYNLFV
jgi:hypothetical protein